MPDATLIAALDNLRDGYSQRQKVTQNLLTARQGPRDLPRAGALDPLPGQFRTRAGAAAPKGRWES
jgi:hypothetical protein